MLPSLGPSIDKVEPLKFEVNDTLTIAGTNLNLSDLSVWLSTVELLVTTQTPNSLQCLVNGIIATGTAISAGSHPLSVVQTLPNGRQRSSNLLVASLLPTVNYNDNGKIITNPRKIEETFVAATITLTGSLLGLSNKDGEVLDDIVLALYQNGRVVEIFDSSFKLAKDQTSLELVMPDNKAVPLGNYYIILRVNGQQAKVSPRVKL